MPVTKIIGIALLVLGLILLYFGYNAATAPVEEVGEALTGRYSDKTMAFLIGGGVSAVVGVVLLLIKGR
ncbi:MAG: DUF3185 family protein [Desulfohalobiaceae bacterium]